MSTPTIKSQSPRSSRPAAFIARKPHLSPNRLADAFCGLIRDAREGQPDLRALVERAVRLGVLCEA